MTSTSVDPVPSTVDLATASASRPPTTDGEDEAVARDNAVTYLQRLPPREEPLTLSPGVVVTNHVVFRERLVERLRSGDSRAYVSPLTDARLYRAALKLG